MTAERDITRIVRSWIREEEHESAERILHTVLARLDTTPQRRRWGPAWRYTNVHNYTKGAIAATAVLLILLASWQFLPASLRGPGGIPTPTPTVTPTPTPAANQSPTPAPAVPPAGPLALGRHSLTLDDVRFTFEIAEPGWTSNGSFGFDKGPIRSPTGAAVIYWFDGADGVFADPCQEARGPAVGPRALDLAEAIAGMSLEGLVELVDGPRSMTIGGRQAQRVIVRIPFEIGCRPDEYYLWYDADTLDKARFATDVGQVIAVWLIDIDGKRLQLDGEWYAGAAPTVGEEVEAIVRSIDFE